MRAFAVLWASRPELSQARARRARARRRLAWCALASALLAYAAPSDAREELLRWRQSGADDVAGFRLHLGFASRAYGEVRDLGRPTPDGSGIFRARVDVADDATLFVALTAYRAGGVESGYSNERVLSVPLEAPGVPVPSASGQGAFDPDRGEFVVRGGLVTLAWAVAPGAVDVYEVYVARDRSTFPSRPEQTTRFASATLTGAAGSTLRVRVVPRGIDGRTGPASPASLPIHFAEPLADPDGDGLPSDGDNCPTVANGSQNDRDGDGVGNACDNCAQDWNPSQQDLDLDGLGDACDGDADGDGESGDDDLCPRVAAPRSVDFDGDGLGDGCDPCTVYRWSLPARNPPDQHPLRGQVVLNKIHKPSKTKLVAKGQFGPAAGAAAIDPASNGAFLSLEHKRGDLLRLNVPPGRPGEQACDKRDGWRSKRGRRGRHTWTYQNFSGALDWPACTPGTARGLRKLVITRRAEDGPFEYKLEATGLPLPRRISEAFLRWTLTLGALPGPAATSVGPASRAGQCAVAFYLGSGQKGSSSSPRCRFIEGRKSGRLEKIRCKPAGGKKRR